jgi:ankyrin repeat protein/predicted RNA binding protein YcfA (HicA-like mRNA interferase family)
MNPMSRYNSTYPCYPGASSSGTPRMNKEFLESLSLTGIFNLLRAQHKLNSYEADHEAIVFLSARLAIFSPDLARQYHDTVHYPGDSVDDHQHRVSRWLDINQHVLETCIDQLDIDRLDVRHAANSVLRIEAGEEANVATNVVAKNAFLTLLGLKMPSDLREKYRQIMEDSNEMEVKQAGITALLDAHFLETPSLGSDGPSDTRPALEPEKVAEVKIDAYIEMESKKKKRRKAEGFDKSLIGLPKEVSDSTCTKRADSNTEVKTKNCEQMEGELIGLATGKDCKDIDAVCNTPVSKWEGLTLLQCAALQCMPYLVQRCKELGANVDTVVEVGRFAGQTAVHIAVQQGSCEGLRMLKKLGANLRALPLQGEFKGVHAVVLAASFEDPKALYALHELGFDVDAPVNCEEGLFAGLRAVHIAAGSKNIPALELLKKLGAEMDARCVGGKYDGLTAFQRTALFKKNVESLHALKRLDVDVKVDALIEGTGPMKGLSVLQCAAINGGNGTMVAVPSHEVLEKLVGLKADANLVISEGIYKGYTPYQAAFLSGADPRILNALKILGATIDEKFTIGPYKGLTVAGAAVLKKDQDRDTTKNKGPGGVPEVFKTGDHKGLTLLQKAAVTNDAATLRSLRNEGIGANAVIQEGQYKGLTPFQAAYVSKADIQVLALLHALGANVDAVFMSGKNKGWSVLHCVARSGSTAVMKHLSTWSKAIDQPIQGGSCEGLTAFQAAFIFQPENNDNLVLLRKSEASVDARLTAKSVEGLTLLHWVATRGFSEGGSGKEEAEREHLDERRINGIARLIQLGATINLGAGESFDGITPFQYAVENGSSTGILKQYIAMGAKVDAPYTRGPLIGLSLIHLAAGRGNIDRLKQLLDLGSNVDLVTPTDSYNGSFPFHSGATPLLVTVQVGFPEVAILEMLIAHKANTQARVIGGRFSGMTALHISAMTGDENKCVGILERLALFHEDGVNVRVGPGKFEGLTALHIATLYGRLAVVDKLIEMGADLTATVSMTDGAEQSAIYFAWLRDNGAALRKLIEHKADPTVVFQKGADSGWNLAHLAAKSEKPNILETLQTSHRALLTDPIQQGPDAGLTATHVAVKYGKRNILTKLKEWELGLTLPASEGLDAGMAPIHMAARNGDVEMLKVLAGLDGLPAEVLQGDFEGYDPFQIAAAHGHVAAMEALIQQRYDPRRIMTTGEFKSLHAAHIAVIWGQPASLAWLLKRDPDVLTTKIKGGVFDGFSLRHLAALYKTHEKMAGFFSGEGILDPVVSTNPYWNDLTILALTNIARETVDTMVSLAADLPGESIDMRRIDESIRGEPSLETSSGSDLNSFEAERKKFMRTSRQGPKYDDFTQFMLKNGWEYSHATGSHEQWKLAKGDKIIHQTLVKNGTRVKRYLVRQVLEKMG